MRWILILLIAIPACAADDFESLCVIPGFGTTPAGNEWTEDQVYAVVKRTINGSTVRTIEQFTPLYWDTDLTDPTYCWFVDCAPRGNNKYQPGQDAVAGTPAVLSTYKYTYVTENGGVWGIPFSPRSVVTLSAGPVIDRGGGTVGITYDNANEAGDVRFASGESVVFAGTSNYNGAVTLTSGTSITELQFTGSYTPETMDGTETVIKQVTTIGGSGRHCVDDDGNLYVGHLWDATNGLVTRIAPDGTQTGSLTFLNTTWPYVGAKPFASPLCDVKCDSTYLYILINQTSPGWGWCEKYELATGNLVWSTQSTYAGYQIAIDDDGNAYGGMAGYVYRFDAADGTMSQMTNSLNRGTYSCIVDDDMGVVVSSEGPLNPWETGYGYNMWIRTLDNSAGDYLLLGDNTGCVTSQIIIYDGYVYVLNYSAVDGFVLYKLVWDGAELTVDASASVSETYPLGIFADIWGDIVLVNQDWLVAQSTVFSYYTTDLVYLNSVPNFSGTLLRTWDAATGGAWISGDATPIGILGTPGTPEVEGVEESWSAADDDILDGLEVCVYADGIPRGEYVMDGNDIVGFAEEDYDVVIAGLNYWSIYESERLGYVNDYGPTYTKRSRVYSMAIDFYNTMGADIGIDRNDISSIQFSDDDWATAIEAYSGYKGPLVFPRGITRDPHVYAEIWEPVPMTIRGFNITMESYEN